MILKHKLEDANAKVLYSGAEFSAACHNGHDSLVRLLLEALGCEPHDHLIEVLVAYGVQKYYFIFPSENENLRKYWEDRPVPHFDRTTVLWSLKQMKGIASALSMIHNFRDLYRLALDREALTPTDRCLPNWKEWQFCHGEILAENILWFKSDSNTIDEFGTLKIADYGLERYYRIQSNSNELLKKGPTFAPPEYSLHNPVSCCSDIWNLGCLYLEFITWLLGGFRLLEAFPEYRAQNDDYLGINHDMFFTIIEDRDNGRLEAEVNKAVVEWVNTLHAHKNCSAVIHDLLDLIMNQLIIVDAEKRIDAGNLRHRLIEQVDKAEADSKYLLDPVPLVRRSRSSTGSLNLAAC